MLVQAAVVLEVQRIKQEENLIQNIKTQGEYLEKYLKSLLGAHPNMGDIHGRGFFWGIKFMRDKQTKELFDPKLGIAQKIYDTAISALFNMTIY
jgi:4-aminobutyrate aminotransferase-like enzyme